MPGFENYSYRQRTYKVWRYPGVPVPHRRQSIYRDPTMNGKKRR